MTSSDTPGYADPELWADDLPTMRHKMERVIKYHQQKIIHCLEDIDGKKFRQVVRDDQDQGGGISAVLQEGNVFEKAGVNVSIVYGSLSGPAIEKMRADHGSLMLGHTENLEFYAAGLSVVVHPRNPMAPTVHLNYRYFETFNPSELGGVAKSWWFGGGTDLTPSYLFPEDCTHFHGTLKGVCDRHDISFYPRFKKWCDEYFYLPHRHEARGVGGIFFDDLSATNVAWSHPLPGLSACPKGCDALASQTSSVSEQSAQDRLFAFCSDCIACFLPSYIPIISKRKDMPFSAGQKDWQQIRRGRYVEFNLLHDRGTSFGLRSQRAKTENVLMSLPLTARWEYMHPVCGTGVEVCKTERPSADVEMEKDLLSCLAQPREWI